MAEKKTAITHILVPKHGATNEEEIERLLSRYNIKKKQLPQISSKDPAIAHMELELGTVIKMSRKNKTSGQSEFYRIVVK
tara:strand:- start:9719 stop:9958 length:240 start_codon:yes stop_codon:yes gene_type:complete